LEKLTISIDRATRLVDQLLTLSRLDALPDLHQQERIDWHQLVTATLAEQERDAHRAGMTLRYEAQGAPTPRPGQA
ncbi:hypothetical protein JVW19_23645, partial [Vibrio cholerae O1]|nr:hypothetical protein [Vibrio cholerae O1]